MKGFSLASKPRVSFVFNPFRPMGFSIKLHAIKTGWFIVYIEGTQVIISKNIAYNKTCFKRPLKNNTKIGFQGRLSLNAGQKYCRMLQECILLYFIPSVSYHLSKRPLFCLFLSGHLRQVLLYCVSFFSEGKQYRPR